MTKNDRPEAHEHDRPSRFVWNSSDIVIIKPGDEAQGKPAPTGAQNPDPAEPKPTKDDGQHEG